MKTYWSLTDKERAALAPEDLDRYRDIERMVAGVGEPVAPDGDLAAAPQPADIGETYFRVRHSPSTYSTTDLGVAFRTREDAAAFLALTPLAVASKYHASGTRDYVEPLAATIIAEQIPAEHEVAARYAPLDGVAEAKGAAKAAREQYEADLEAYGEATVKLDDDLARIREIVREAARVEARFLQYVDVAEGDEVVAAKFLRNAFDADTIEAAFDWLGRKLPPLALIGGAS